MSAIEPYASLRPTLSSLALTVKFYQVAASIARLNCGISRQDAVLSSRTQLITQNSGLQALSSKESAKNQCVINSVQLLKTLMGDRLYEGTNIRGRAGLTNAQKATLKVLGALI